MDPLPCMSRVSEATNAKRVEGIGVVQEPFLRLRIHDTEHDRYGFDPLLINRSRFPASRFVIEKVFLYVYDRLLDQ